MSDGVVWSVKKILALLGFTWSIGCVYTFLYIKKIKKEVRGEMEVFLLVIAF
jgi:hypothetical protein